MPLFILILALDNATSSWEEGTHWFGIKIGHFAPESKVPLLAKRLPLALFWNDFDLVIPNAIVLFNNKSSNQRHMTSKTDVQTNIKDLGQCRGGGHSTWSLLIPPRHLSPTMLLHSLAAGQYPQPHHATPLTSCWSVSKVPPCYYYTH